jgi:hypothetical protein
MAVTIVSRLENLVAGFGAILGLPCKGRARSSKGSYGRTAGTLGEHQLSVPD